MRLATELEQGVSCDPRKTTWCYFCERYEREVLDALATKTKQKGMATIRAITDIIGPKLLISFDAQQISVFSAHLREQGLRPYTVRGHMAEVRKMMRWARSQNLLATLPSIVIPSATGVHGRAITQEEFERMLAATPSIVGHERAESFLFLQRGLWLSGLRLAESLILRWDDEQDLSIDMSGRYPLMRIQAHSEKGRTSRILPITPDFAEFLQAVPKQNRRGFVFSPQSDKPHIARMQPQTVGKLISQIGEKAKVKTAQFPAKGRGKAATVKYASAHDFRRAFGWRWAQRVMPVVLQQLMRHATIQTTMQFYVGRQAEAAAETLWQGVANTLANTVEPSTEMANSSEIETFDTEKT